jgi:hypothetical protein
VKFGGESRGKMIGAIVLGGLALVLLLRAFLSSSSPEASSAASSVSEVAAGAGPRRTASTGRATHLSAPRLDPTLQLNLLKQSEDTKYAGSGRNIFVSQAEEIPKPVAAPVIAEQPPPPPPPPPPAPPPFKFFGFANKPGEPKKVFLSNDGDVFIAGEGEIVNRRYRILHIGTQSVEVEDVLNNNRQTIPLTQG